MPEFGRFGFGFLRLPQLDLHDNSSVDLEETKKMVDLFLQQGFCYFDTAYTYLKGKSEAALKEALVDRYPRESFMIATKFPPQILNKGKSQEEVFREQLARCGVEYFDVYLLHGLDREDADFAEENHCFAYLQKMKQEGRVRYTGFSFHDTAEVLDGILTRHPEVDLVQIQLNYLDWDNEIIQSKACWEVCRKHGKSVIVMEPVKGGTLANIPEKAAVLFQEEKPAHRALRFAASQEGVALVLSGMSTVDQVRENTKLMSKFHPLTKEETDVLKNAAEIIRNSVAIPCTGCGYCMEVCPAKIPIPSYVSLYNERERDGWQVNTEGRYKEMNREHPGAKACIKCRKCEQRCPQKLSVTDWIQKISDVFDLK